MTTNDLIKNICNAKRKELLSLPHKAFAKVETYNYIIIVPTPRTHDSGWRLMALVGCKAKGNNEVPCELIGYCDDINWILPDCINGNLHYKNILRTDMTLSNCTRVWSNNHMFQVGTCLSSVDIKVIRTN